MGDLDASHDAILDRALVETYRLKGITTDPANAKKPTPDYGRFIQSFIGNGRIAIQRASLKAREIYQGKPKRNV